MFEILIIVLGVVALVLLWINNSNQKDIYDKLLQLYEITNKIHSLLVKKQ